MFAAERTAVLTELLGTVALGDIGLSTIIVIIILMILFDKLVTRKRLEECREDGAGWRTAFERQQEINSELRVVATESLALARSSDHALRSIQAMGAAVFAAQGAPETEERNR